MVHSFTPQFRERGLHLIHVQNYSRKKLSGYRLNTNCSLKIGISINPVVSSSREKKHRRFTWFCLQALSNVYKYLFSLHEAADFGSRLFPLNLISLQGGK